MRGLIELKEIMRTRNKFQFGSVNGNADGSRIISLNTILVWVQCKGYRCLAYADATGRWVNFYTGKALTDFVDVIG